MVACFALFASTYSLRSVAFFIKENAKSSLLMYENVGRLFYLVLIDELKQQVTLSHPALASYDLDHRLIHKRTCLLQVMRPNVDVLWDELAHYYKYTINYVLEYEMF